MTNDKNIMKNPRIVKCVVSIGVGDGGEKLQRAKKVLTMLTGQKPVDTMSRTTNADLGIRKGQTIGCKVTLRGKTAYEFLKKAFWVKENYIWDDSFDNYGNFAFGIEDYTDFEGMSYNPNIGVFGMDISVQLERKGNSITQRSKQKRSIPERHKLTLEEGHTFVRKAFGVEVIE
ncbi:MAG: 50S ribosomal protein L5 [Thermoplasmata archaeon]